MEYSTITISVRVKKKLEELKGDLNWDEFLEKIADEMRKIKRIRAAKKLLKDFPLSDEEAEMILNSIEESRKLWKARKGK